MDTFYEPLLQMETFAQIEEALKKDEGLTLVTGCVDSQKTHLMYGLGREWPVKLILTYSELKAKEMYFIILRKIFSFFMRIFREMNC